MATNANALRTIFTYPVSGVGPYTVAFDYLARKFVQVTLIGPDRKLLVLTTDYRFISKTQIQLNVIPDSEYTSIEIRRYTDAQDRLVDFQDSSILRAADLNVSQVQTMHIAEEGRDVASNTLGVDTNGDLDARGRKLVNLSDGVADGDAVTVRQEKAWGQSSYSNAVNAANAAAAALLSEQHSKTSETNSKTSETNSKTSETMAQKWAANPAGTLVDATRYSSLHYSVQSESSRAAAVLAQQSAEGAAFQAGQSNIGAQNAATTATQQADRAESEADRAQTANPDNQLKKANNLSDVASVTTTRTNLSVYSKAETDAFQPIVMTWAQAVAAGWVGAISTLTVPDQYDLMVTVSPNNIRVTGILGVTGGAGIPTAIGIYGISKYPTGKSGVHKPRQPCTYITQGTGNWGATASSKVDVLYSGSGTAGLTSYILTANAAGIFIDDVWYFI